MHSLAAVQLLLSIELSNPAGPGHTAIQPLVDGGPTHSWLQNLPLAPRSPRGGLAQNGSGPWGKLVGPRKLCGMEVVLAIELVDAVTGQTMPHAGRCAL